MEQAIVIVIFIAGIGLTIWSANKFRRFEAAYRFKGSFNGVLHVADVGWPQFESKYACRVGADAEALYLMRDPSRVSKGWSYGYRTTLGRDLRIPWVDIEYRTGEIYASRVMWFELKSGGMAFYLPVVIGSLLVATCKAM